MNKQKLKDRVAIITGASSGIGEALAYRMAGAGCRVGLIARRRELLEKIADNISRKGGTAIPLPADVINADQIKSAVYEVINRWGQVDIAVANAGIGPFTRIATMNVTALRNIMDINFYGAWHLFEAVLPNMLERETGHLVGVSTFASLRGMQRMGPYGASKAALNIILESGRVELIRKGINCTTVIPSYVTTPLTEPNRGRMPFMVSAEKAASVILKAIIKKRRQVIFPWQYRLLSPLFRNLPGWIFDFMFK